LLWAHCTTTIEQHKTLSVCITGTYGVGKTYFLHKFRRYLNKNGRRFAEYEDVCRALKNKDTFSPNVVVLLDDVEALDGSVFTKLRKWFIPPAAPRKRKKTKSKKAGHKRHNYFKCPSLLIIVNDLFELPREAMWVRTLFGKKTRQTSDAPYTSLSKQFCPASEWQLKRFAAHKKMHCGPDTLKRFARESLGDMRQFLLRLNFAVDHGVTERAAHTTNVFDDAQSVLAASVGRPPPNLPSVQGPLADLLFYNLEDNLRSLADLATMTERFSAGAARYQPYLIGYAGTRVHRVSVQWPFKDKASETKLRTNKNLLTDITPIGHAIGITPPSSHDPDSLCYFASQFDLKMGEMVTARKTAALEKARVSGASIRSMKTLLDYYKIKRPHISKQSSRSK
jgi:hypothetical protein